MRRLVSNFTGGWAAVGLLLIRVAAGSALIVDGRERLYLGQSSGLLALGLITIVDGAILIVGSWTPVAGVMALALSICDVLIYRQGLCPAILLASMGLGVALVGPGALSVDAWLFGLKRIDIERLERPPDR